MIKIGRCSFDILSVVGRELTFHFSISDYAWMIEWIMSIYNWCVVSQITYKKRFGTANGRYFCKKVVKVPWLIDPIKGSFTNYVDNQGGIELIYYVVFKLVNKTKGGGSKSCQHSLRMTPKCASKHIDQKLLTASS